MSIVLDASAAFTFLADESADERIMGEKELLAPDVIVAELLNARWKVERSKLVAPEVETAVEFLGRLRIVPALHVARDAAALAKRLDHPVYDCLYVALAQRESAKLLTFDKRLIEKLTSARLGSMLLR